MSASADLHQRYRAVLPSFISPYYAEPISIDRGEGGFVWDLEGTRYLDFFGGVLTTMIGHNHPAVAAAVQAQAGKVMHTSTLYLSEPMIELAEQIAHLSQIPDARVFFTTSGSEANDTIVKLVWYHWNLRGRPEKKKILARHGAYHGVTLGATSLSGLPAMHALFDALAVE